jgi:hypothetical protein
MLKRFAKKGLVVGLSILFVLAVIWVIYGFTQSQEGDSTRPEFKFVRVKIGLRTTEDLQYLKAMGIECPKSGECVVIITEAQRRQIEKAGLKAKGLTGLRPDQGPNLVEYKLVREIDLEKENVGGIVFGLKSATRSAMPQMAQRDYWEILFYSPDFKMLHTYKQNERFTDVYPSKTLQYVGIVTPVKIPTVEEPIGRIRFTLINNKGEKLWEKEEENYYDALKNLFFISGDGLVVEVDKKTGALVFYDENGRKTKEVEFFRGEMGDWETHYLGGRFTLDGRYFMAVGHDFHRKVFPKKSGVILFDNKGNELWRHDIERDLVLNFISPTGKFSIITGFDLGDNGTHKNNITSLFTEEGKLLKSFNDVYATDVCFSSDETHALINSEKGLFLIDLPTAEVLLKYGLRGFYQINSLDIAEDAKVFGFATTFSAVFIIGFDGSKVWSQTFSTEGGKFTLSLSDDGRQLAVQIGSKVMLYQKVE